MSSHRRGTSIIATVGPAVEDPARLDRLVAAGASVLRVNLSHGDRDSHDAWIDRIRDAEARAGRAIGILADLPGPKLRLTGLSGGSRHLAVGESITLGDTEGVGDLHVTIPGLLASLAPGHRVLIDDGLVRLLVETVSKDHAVCRVMTSGAVSQGKGVNLPDSNPPLQVPTDGDMEKAIWAQSRGIDFLGQSFVGTADELRTLRAVLPGHETDPLIIAKIERPIAVNNLESIMQEADAVMVARGDLGVEMEIATVPVVQQQILQLARHLGRPCIVATQMLQSMIESASPTRAEAGDVATAIRDGADAVMLSGETSIGNWPDLAVSTMARIAEVTESHMDQETDFPEDKGVDPAVAALCEATWSTVVRLGALGVLCRSRRGIWAARLSRARLGVPIIAVTDSPTAARRMALLRDVFPVVLDAMPAAVDAAPCCGLDDATLQAMLRVPSSCVLIEVGSGSGDASHPALHLAVRTIGR